MQKLKDLWHGRLSLEVAFWHYAIFYGLLVNIAATVAALALIVLNAPIAVAIIVHLLPLPYLIVTARGVWRSADGHADKRGFPTFARVAVLAWCCFWLAA